MPAHHQAAKEPMKAAAQPFNWQRYRKLFVGIAGLAASLLAQGLIPDPWAHYVAAGLAALTAVGIYAAPNTPAPADAEAGTTRTGVVLFVAVIIVALALGFAANHLFLLLLILALLLLLV